MNRFATFTVTLVALVVASAAPATAIPLPPDSGTGQAGASQQRNLTEAPHRMPYLFRVGPEYLP
jgi:hypothetical protein